MDLETVLHYVKTTDFGRDTHRYVLAYQMKDSEKGAVVRHWTGDDRTTLINAHKNMFRDILCMKYPAFIVYDRHASDVVLKHPQEPEE